MNSCVLLITPTFFGYESSIVSELERQGFTVTLVDERPSNSSFSRALIRWRRGSLGHAIDRYYRAWRERLAGRQFDLVIVVKAEVVPRWFLEEIRSGSPGSYWVYYTFDSIRNNPNCTNVLDLFDQRFSFDSVDVRRGEHGLRYLPLFYTAEFTSLPVGDLSSTRWDVSFIGTLHTDRYPLVSAICSGEIRAYTHLYIQARWYFGFEKYITRSFRNVPWSSVSTRPLTRAEIAANFAESRAVLDIQRAVQTGLTMRTFEALATGAVLVTTNPSIRSEPFYDPERVVLVDRDATKVDVPSLHRLLLEIPRPASPPPGFEEYSLTSWVRRITSKE